MKLKDFRLWPIVQFIEITEYGFILLLALCSLVSTQSSMLIAQITDEEVRTAIEKVDQGASEDVKKILPDLISKYQNTPGMIYLQGRLASDGVEAVKFYQGVVDNFPKSEWSDDALIRIYQYYYSLGLYRTADLKMQQLKKEYPNSSYVTGKSEIKLPRQEETPVKLPKKEIVSVDTQQIAKTQTPTNAGSYTLQAGAFSTLANAEKQKAFFEDLGYSVEITNKIRSGLSMYLVWIGSFKTIQHARTTGKEIKSKYKIDTMIIEKY